MRISFCLYFSIALLLFLNSGCASIQLATVSIKEHFQQTLSIDGVPTSELTNEFGYMLRIHNEEEKDSAMITKFLNSPLGDSTTYALVNNLVITDGILDLAIYLLPQGKLTAFQVTGGGHYDIFNKRTKQIYFSSTFRLTGCNNCDDIGRLYQRKNPQDSLIATFSQVAINQFDYEHEAGKRYKHTPMEDFEVHIKILHHGKKRISIDYAHCHPVYFRNNKIGELKFTPPVVPNSKIIDLRGLKTLLRKYKDLAPTP